MRLHPVFLAAVCSPAMLSLAACHSYRIDAVVENRTGEKIELLEIDYPSASFGVDALASGADYHYRFQVRGSGPVKVQYTDSASTKVRQVAGPSLYEHEEGSLEIVLLPEGKAEFHPQLSTHP